MKSKFTFIKPTIKLALEQNGNDHDIINQYIDNPTFSQFSAQLEELIMQDFEAFKLGLNNAEQNIKVEKFQFENLNSDKTIPHLTIDELVKFPENDAMKIPSQLNATSSAEAKTNHTVSFDQRNIQFISQNARSQEYFTSKISPDKERTESYQIVDIVIPEELGLNFDDVLHELSGIPQNAGVFDISISYRLADEELNRVSILKLTVTPNPKSMWLNKPSNQSDRFWKIDETSQFIQGQHFNIVAASKRGRSHAHVGSFREDDFSIAYDNQTDWCIGVVSDGAGSCLYSRRGSQIICETSLAHIQSSLVSGKSASIEVAAEKYTQAIAQQLDAAVIEELKTELRKELYVTVSHAAYHSLAKITEEVKILADVGAKVKDFSSTALITISKKFSFGTLCAAYWVGDGAVAIYSQKNGVTLLGEVDSGEFSGQTRFLDNDEVSAESLMKRLRFDIVDDMTAFMLLSDGITDPFFETEARLTRSSEWDALWADIDASVHIKEADTSIEQGNEKAQRLLNWLDFWSQGNHDDRTIAIIY